ncbi:hypothetical protein MKW98_012404, partial [Papaver atlanticum]
RLQKKIYLFKDLHTSCRVKIQAKKRNLTKGKIGRETTIVGGRIKIVKGAKPSISYDKSHFISTYRAIFQILQNAKREAA